MLKVGITGLMGSGKSYISSLFADIGVPIYNSDKRASYLTKHNKNLKEDLIKEFGDIYLSDSNLNKELVTNLIFSKGNEKNLVKYNSIFTEYIFRDFNTFCCINFDKYMILAESALLFESGMDKLMDKNIFVNASYTKRLQRTYERSGLSKDQYDERMRSQLPLKIKVDRCDIIINNDDDSEKNKIVETYYNFLIAE